MKMEMEMEMEMKFVMKCKCKCKCKGTTSYQVLNAKLAGHHVCIRGWLLARALNNNTMKLRNIKI